MRLTQKKDKTYLLDPSKVTFTPEGLTGEGVEHLGRYEDFLEDLLMEYRQVLQQMENLPIKGRSRSYRFMELMNAKMRNEYVFSRLSSKGLTIDKD
jgi:hypothetical protein